MKNGPSVCSGRTTQTGSGTVAPATAAVAAALVGLGAKSSPAFVDSQLNKCRVSMKRPAFERAPRTTTATC